MYFRVFEKGVELVGKVQQDRATFEHAGPGGCVQKRWNLGIWIDLNKARRETAELLYFLFALAPLAKKNMEGSVGGKGLFCSFIQSCFKEAAGGAPTNHFPNFVKRRSGERLDYLQT